MSNYYEILGLQLTSTQAEIKTAMDKKYAYLNRLTLHHDLKIAHQASQALQALKKIHSVLTNPVLREQYDVKISMNGSGKMPELGKSSDLVGEDLSKNVHPVAFVLLPHMENTLLPGSQIHPSWVVNWVCTRCQSVYPVKTFACTKCGQTLGKNCPKCRAELAIIAERCFECGLPVRRHEEWIASIVAKGQAAGKFIPVTFIFSGTEHLPSQVINWVCTRCCFFNPIKTLACEKCGQRVGKYCPQCHDISAIIDEKCSECGRIFSEPEGGTLENKNLARSSSNENSAVASSANAVSCPKCNSITLSDARFCGNCGTQLQKPCPKCNSLLEVSAQFCSHCGVNVNNI